MLTQRQIDNGVFGVITVGAALLAAVSGFLGPETVALIAGVALSCAGLWAAHARGWAPAGPALVVILTAAVALGNPDVSERFDPVVFVVPVVAMLVASGRWALISAGAVLATLLARAGGGGVYAEPGNLIEFAAVVVGMLLSRAATDNARHVAELSRAAEEARAAAERQAAALAEQAEELRRRADEQARLLGVVAALEAPAVQIADGVLFVPIVGHLDSDRAEAITARLLEEAHRQRAAMVVLDIAGVPVVDTAVAQGLQRTCGALRLLGCDVAVSGIGARVAASLVQLGATLDGVTSVRTPQDALDRRAGRRGATGLPA